MALKVIGAGFGRTGTTSLKLALEQLGFDKCYHMREGMKKHKAKVWYEISQGKPVDWDKIFKGYQATVDWPACMFYKELMEQYPDAKVLLTVRDPDKWYDSALNTIYYGNKMPYWASFYINPMKYTPLMTDHIIWDGTFDGKFTDREHTINVFKKHIEEVKSYVPPEKLLVYEVKQGWEPLCRFLNVPIPEGKPFPLLNDKVHWHKRITRRNRFFGLVSIALPLVSLYWGWYFLRKAQAYRASKRMPRN